MSTVNDLVIACRRQGIVMAAEGEDLRVEGPNDALTEDLLSEIKDHKPELLAALSEKINRWRVTHAGGRITEHSSRGLTRSEALELARCFGEPVRAEPVGVDPPSPPGDLSALLEEACQGVEGIRGGRIRVLAAATPKTTLTSRVRCIDCRHFERDPIGDGAGIGRCRVQGEGTSPGQPCLWPMAERQCKNFKSREGMA